MSTAEVRWWADQARKATTARDEAIVELREQGATLRAIGEAAGMSHAAIARVLARRG